MSNVRDFSVTKILTVLCLVLFGVFNALPTFAETMSVTTPKNISRKNNSRIDWMMNCQGCHGANGDRLNADVPPMRHEVAKFLAIDGGRAYLVQVPGVANAAMNSKRLANLLNWMLVTFDPEHLPRDFKPYTASEVSELRKRSLMSNALRTREKLVTSIERINRP